MFYRFDPGPCPVDDAPHTTCCNPAAPALLSIVQLPARDDVHPPPLVGALEMPGALAMATAAPPAPTTFTTATYRRRRKPSEER